MATFSNSPDPVVELHEAVSLLTEPQPPDPLAEVDWRALGIHLLPSLLDQLVEAVESSSSRGGAARSRQTAPASLDVIGLLDTIDRRVAEGLRTSGYRGRLDLGRYAQIRTWVSYAGSWRATRPNYLYQSIGEVRRWISRAENILTPDPQTIETKAQPCPNCGERTAMVHSDELGERVQRPSLYLDKGLMTVFCRCCGEQWPPSMLDFLSRVLSDRSAAESLHSAR